MDRDLGRRADRLEMDGSIWTPVFTKGYVLLGCVGQDDRSSRHAPPTVEGFVGLRADLAVQTTARRFIWEDSHSGAPRA